eukprot:scaffold58992_cov32-Tisochrysis_lutea.AAC.4
MLLEPPSERIVDRRERGAAMAARQQEVVSWCRDGNSRQGSLPAEHSAAVAQWPIQLGNARAPPIENTLGLACRAASVVDRLRLPLIPWHLPICAPATPVDSHVDRGEELLVAAFCYPR